MTEPLALLPLALAAGGGRLRATGSAGELQTQQLVAAGLTLLQRSAPLVRALSGKRSAILLPTGPAYVTALAASDGRGALLLDPLAAPAEIARQCSEAKVGAVFTTVAFASAVPAGLTTVLLDEAPRTARVLAGGVARDVDLGSHYGLALEGEREAEGRDEEAAIVYTAGMRDLPVGAVLTHANLLSSARSAREGLGSAAEDHMLALLPFSHPFGLLVAAGAPLLAGARVTTMERFELAAAVDLLAGDVTQVAGVPATYVALLSALERGGGPSVRGGALRLCVCAGAPLAPELQDRWFEATGVELRQGYGLTEAGPLCLFNRADRPNARGTLGVPMPGVEVAILPAGSDAQRTAAGTDLTPVANGRAGEICVRGASVSPGYLGGATGLDRRGAWLCTGDLGVRRADGAVEFLGKAKPASGSPEGESASKR